MKRSDMKHLIGKSALLEIDYHGKTLYFKAICIKSVTTTHISFIDKFGKDYSFRCKDVVEANQVDG
jgi:hypothetical protein